MSNLLTHIERWLRRPEQRFADLPTIQVRPAPTPEGHPDHTVGECLRRKLIFKVAASHTLEASWSPWPKDEAADELRSWRMHTDWAFGEARYYLTHGGPRWVTA